MDSIIWQKVEQMARIDMAQLVFDAETAFDRQVESVARQLFEVPELRLAMIAGPSSSGKTTFCNLLAEKLQQFGVCAHRVSLDDFFIDRDRVPLLPSGLKDFDSPAALDLAELHRVMSGIMHDEWVELPRYDFMTGRSHLRVELMRLHPEDIVLIEGIHALNPLLIQGQDAARICRIGIKPRRSYVMPSGAILQPDDLRLLRRTIRDFYTRGHTLEATLAQWQEVRRAEDIYITPYLDKADYNIDSGFTYELYVYKHCLKSLMDDCDLPAFAAIRQAMREVKEMPLIQIPTTSLLNEFAILQ